MAGIYIHIPFCKQACNYCNFYFSTSLHFKVPFLAALLKEISLQKDYLENEIISSIYFGGGTPSILKSEEIATILIALEAKFDIATDVEITLEANPDDLSREKLHDLYAIGVNRLSIGIQSFFEEDLQFMNRAHHALEAKQCLKDAGEIGFKNLSIDLIYGAPTQSIESWKQNLAYLAEFNINHLSSYALTVEEGTPLYHLIRKGKSENVDENLASIHFKVLSDWAKTNGWEHYEISNLCSNGNYSKHNTSYWQGKKYLGLGPAAHSFNGTSRQWNTANLKKYIDAITKNELTFEIEILSEINQFNEYIMTGLRTIWGVDLEFLQTKFPKFYLNFEKEIQNVNPDWIKLKENKLTLSDEGRFFADGIASSLFVE